jgi:hypothetical protein
MRDINRMKTEMASRLQPPQVAAGGRSTLRTETGAEPSPGTAQLPARPETEIAFSQSAPHRQQVVFRSEGRHRKGGKEMKTLLKPLPAFLMVLVAVPAFAQQGNPPSGEPAMRGQTPQAAAASSPATEKAEPVQVEGTIASLTADQIELKVEKAMDPNSESTAGLVGQTVSLVLEATTEKPDGLKVGDRVDLWFSESNGERHATRVALDVSEGAPSNGGAEPQSAALPPGNGSAPGSQPPQAAAGPAPASPNVEPVEVTGTIISLSADQIELLVEKAANGSADAVTGLVGQPAFFVLDAATEQPYGLKQGDRVDLWFSMGNNERHAVRVVEAPLTTKPAVATQPKEAAVPPSGGPASTGHSAPAAAPAAKAAAASASSRSPKVNASSAAVVSKATKASKTHSEPAATSRTKAAAAAQAPAPPKAAANSPAGSVSTTTSVAGLPNAGAAETALPPSPAANGPLATSPAAAATSPDAGEAVGAPEPGSPSHSSSHAQAVDPLRFVWLGAGVGLIALVLLFFTLRAGHIDLGIGSGEGGVH